MSSTDPYGAAARAYDLFYRTKDYAGEVDEIVELVDARVPGAQSVLDVGCGTGAHLEHLATRYERAEGIEASPRMIEEATIARPGLLVYPGDMRTFRVRDRYDVVTCLFSAIGYMTTVEDLDHAIANMAEHLREPGLLVVEGWVERDHWDEHHRAVAQAEIADDIVATRVILSGRDGDVSTLDMHYVFATLDGVTDVQERHRLGLFTPAQYRAAFVAAGLAYERVDGLSGRGVHLGVKGTRSPRAG
ncbi:MAG TPA: class I SAM-dependent methyltransferase [Acidimicrobiia bacterium]